MTYTEEQVQEALRWAETSPDEVSEEEIRILAAALRDAMDEGREVDAYVAELVTEVNELKGAIAAHDARLLDEAAERAMEWLKTLHHEPEPGLPWSDKIQRMQDLQVRTLRAAVRGKE